MKTDGEVGRMGEDDSAELPPGDWFAIWTRYFPNSNPSRRHTVDLMHYTVSVLSGLAATKMLEGPDAGDRTSELDFLKDTLCRELA